MQTLIHHFPQALPIAEIEPGRTGASPVCMELPTPVGSVDNLLATARGDLVLVEGKLWRNPEARRKVVAQIIDDAVCMAAGGYDDLQDAIAEGWFAAIRQYTSQLQRAVDAPDASRA